MLCRVRTGPWTGLRSGLGSGPWTGRVQWFGGKAAATLLRKAPQRQPLLLPRLQAFFCSAAAAPPSDASLKYRYGRLMLEVPLPSRNEKCLFYLKPMLMSVGDLIADLQREDQGVQTASVFSKDGERVANTTLLDALLDNDFQLVINNASYHVQTPEKACGSRREHAMELGDVKHVVHLLHTALHLPDHHVQQERLLLERLDGLKQQLSPLETVKAELARKAESQSSRALWGGMALLSVQGGALAWLTWWVYSWDVMEPVTYFITYGTSLGVFAYCVLANQDYVYPAAKDRQFLNYFYKGAKKKRFNVEKYNELRDELTQVQEDLKRLQSSTQLQLPLQQIEPKP